MYRVYYSNLRKREKTQAWQTYEEAEKSAKFLKWQGAKKIKIVKEGKEW